jgi:hypothetical protein
MRCAILMVGLVLAANTSAVAQDRPPSRPETVDTALVLAVDVSESVSPDRYTLQMEGIARAFEDEDMRSTISSGGRRPLFVSLVEWSDKPTVSIPWTLIMSTADMQAFSNRVRRTPRGRGIFTCMSRALQYIDDKVLPFLPVSAAHTVIDVSSDGQENCDPARPVDDVRADLIAEQVTINGLPILEGSEADTLAQWYEDHVIGGHGAFLIPAYGFQDFQRAMLQKFAREISAAGSKTRYRYAGAPRIHGESQPRRRLLGSGGMAPLAITPEAAGE